MPYRVLSTSRYDSICSWKNQSPGRKLIIIYQHGGLLCIYVFSRRFKEIQKVSYIEPIGDYAEEQVAKNSKIFVFLLSAKYLHKHIYKCIYIFIICECEDSDTCNKNYLKFFAFNESAEQASRKEGKAAKCNKYEQCHEGRMSNVCKEKPLEKLKVATNKIWGASTDIITNMSL